MKQTNLFNKLVFLFAFVFLGTNLQGNAQTLNTTVASTGYTGTNSAGNGYAITFVIENSSTQSIILTDVGDWTNSTDNGQTFSLYYSSSSLSGTPPTTYPATGWTLAGQNTVSSITSSTLGVNDVISNMNLIIPANTSYRFALHTTGTRRYSGSGVGTCTPNTFTSGGVNLYVGDYQINSMYVGYGATNNPRFFTGSVTFMPATACAGQPSAGTIPSTLAVCPSTSFNITATGATLAANMVYQWQSRNPAGTGVWTNITGANSASYTSTGILTSTDYRFITTCTPSGLSDTTTVLTTTINPPGQCYCIPTYTYGCSSDNINNVILAGDVSPGINNLNTPCSPTYYSDYTSMSATLTAGFTYNGNVTTTYGSASENVRIWIDYNNDGTFQSTEEIGTLASISNTSTGAYTFTVPITQASGSYRMRVRLVYSTPPASIDPCSNESYGEAHDYTVNIIASTPCVGTPSAGTVPATLAVCPSVPFSLVSTGSTLAGNMTTQWQSRNPAGTGIWADITGATAASYTVTAGITTPTDYRYISKCNTSGLSDTTTIMTTTINPANQCYCIPSGNSASYYIDTFTTSLGSTNINNLGSGYSTNGYGDFTTQTVTQNIGSVVSFHAVYGSGFNSYGTKIWVDWNQDGVFADPGEVVYSTSSYATSEDGNFVVPATALTGTTRMRIGISYTPSTGPATPCETSLSGEYEDYTFVVTSPSCAVPSGLAVSNIATNTATISWTAASPAPANGYEYYQSTSSTAPTAATVATGATAAGIVTKDLTGLTPNTTYHIWVRSVCSSSNKSDWTLSTSFTSLCSIFLAPFSEGLNGGTLPSCWFSTTDVGQTSANAFWKFTGTPGYGTTGNGRPAGTYAWVDASVPNTGIHTVTLTSPPIDLTPLTTGYVVFDWFKDNDNGATTPLSNNKLTVEVNDGTGWVSIFSDTSNADVWRTEGIPLAASYSNATIQLRFVVDKDAFGAANFYDDLLLDSIQVKEAPLACTGTPSAGTIPTTLAVCPGQPINLVATGVTTNVLGLTGQWQFRTPAGSGAWVDIVGATSESYTVASAPATPTDYRYTLTCTTNTGVSNTMTTTINPANQCYCIPSNSYSTSYYISDFSTTGGITNITNNGTGFSPTGYGDYTTTDTVSAMQGGMVDVSVSSMLSSTYSYDVWVDWDQDGNFNSTDEHVLTTNGSYVSAPFTGTITVPTTALPGSTRMRVRNAYISSPAPVCGPHDYGEAEDYTFTVSTACTTPIVNLGPDTTICAGQSLTLDAGNPTLTFLWNDNTTNQTLIVDTAGTYSVTVTDGACFASDTIVVSVTPMPVVDLGNDTTICEGQTLTLHAGNAGASYLWNDNSTGSTLDVTTAGTYSVKVTNGVCNAKDTIMVSVDPLPTADTIEAVNSGSCNYTFRAINPQHVTGYSWTFGDGSPNDTNAVATHAYAGNGSYLAVLTMTNDCGTTTMTTTINCTDVGIRNIDISKDALKLYPNPTSDKITIENTSNLNMEYVTVFNVLGQVVYQSVPQSAVKHQMNVSNLASGLYTVRIKTNEGMVVRKFEVLK